MREKIHEYDLGEQVEGFGDERVVSDEKALHKLVVSGLRLKKLLHQLGASGCFDLVPFHLQVVGRVGNDCEGILHVGRRGHPHELLLAVLH